MISGQLGEIVTRWIRLWNVVLPKIALIVPIRPRVWQERLAERLLAGNHALAIERSVSSDRWPPEQALVLALERRLLNRGIMMQPAALASRGSAEGADLILDMSGQATSSSAPVLQLAFDGRIGDGALPAILAAGRLPDLDVLLDGRLFDHAAPMADSRVFVSSASDDILARAVTLLLRAVDRYFRGDRVTAPYLPARATPDFARHYLAQALPRVAREAMRRSRYRYAHWRVGYRFVEDGGVARGKMLGSGWHVLEDDGSRFFADPFPLEHEGRHYVFVEDYRHSTGKAVISVSEIGPSGEAGFPEPVLEEPHHLSYPQVFVHEGAIWMLPEASASGRLTLYRAARFPHRWQPETVLLEGELSDATLLRHDGRFWLFATDRDGGGSTSDTLVVFHAPELTGPWTAHRGNPILIDRRRARPGGAFIQASDGIWLPVQDGTRGYGEGLGLSRLLRLDEDAVELGEPVVIDGTGDFPYPRIHTLNRAGRLEVIDGIAPMLKRQAVRSAA